MPRIRLLFDELLPHRVAQALRILGFNVSHVGAEEDGAPPRGSDDDVVLDHAKATNQTVVTYNHNMILLCAEQKESVIWVDPRGRQIRRTRLTVMAFEGIETWERLLQESTEPCCIHVMRTKTEKLTMDRAAHLARQRIKRIEARERRRATQAQPERSPRMFDPEPPASP